MGINIVEGILNNMFPKEYIEEEYKRKLNICLDCTHFTKGFLGYKCGSCGCPLRTKLKSNSGCPLNKF